MRNGTKKLKKTTKIIIGIISILIIIMILGVLLLFNSIKVNDKVLNYLHQFEEYVESGEYDKAEEVLKKAEDLKSTEEGKEKLELMKKIEKSETLLEEATNLMKKEKYEEAKDKLNKIHANEGKIYVDAQEKIKECDDALVDINFEKAKQAFDKGDYDSALKSITDVLNVRKDDEEAKNLQEEIIQKRDEKLAKEEAERKQKEEEEKKEREAFTEDEAVEFLREKLENKENLSLEVQNAESNNGKEGYMIQVSEMMDDHLATIGWYFIDKYNKEAFEWDMLNNKLIEIN
ncbi:Hypothetical protein CM240_0475 [Clostridium bornimense]|uniref:Uncharacterized protein n=1 Tax=Clostridium bornimense TaxID=1216932 RepID=W6SDC0_9CLOT|nr:hypothetical protein [Clostridium bornimense]CDM67640.1 Hypothetical protein CM240_0475 [Clostridium bornimense]